MKGWNHSTYRRLVLSPRVRGGTTALQCSPNARRSTDGKKELASYCYTCGQNRGCSCFWK